MPGTARERLCPLGPARQLERSEGAGEALVPFVGDARIAQDQHAMAASTVSTSCGEVSAVRSAQISSGASTGCSGLTCMAAPLDAALDYPLRCCKTAPSVR